MKFIVPLKGPGQPPEEFHEQPDEDVLEDGWIENTLEFTRKLAKTFGNGWLRTPFHILIGDQLYEGCRIVEQTGPRIRVSWLNQRSWPQG
jgi:hypothetical protein